MVAIVTGASSGIGAAIAEELTLRGCLVLMGCRDVERGDRMKRGLRQSAKLIVLPLDLSSPQSIEAFLSNLLTMPELLPVQILVNNAAIFDSPERFTPSGLEMHFAVNHMGHFHLTTRMLEINLFAKGARIITVASALAAHVKLDSFEAYKESFSDELARLPASRLYANSKLANCLFTRELHKRFREDFNSFCVQTDGMSNTNLFRNPLARTAAPLRCLLRLCAYLFLRSPHEAAQNAIHCCAASELFLRPGALYSKCRPVGWFDAAVQHRAAESLWEVSEEILASRMPPVSLSFGIND